MPTDAKTDIIGSYQYTTERPLLSFITLSYNRPTLLLETFKSFQKQTLPNWEWIVIDGSALPLTNAIRQILLDRRVHVYRSEGNEISRLWNFGIQRCHGVYVNIHDDDNLKAPTFVEKVVAFMEANPTYVGCASYWNVIDAEGKVVGERAPFSVASITPEALRNENCVDGGAAVYRKEILEAFHGYDTKLNTSEDWDMIIRATSMGTIGILPEYLHMYRSGIPRRSDNAGALGRIKDEKYFLHKSNWRIQIVPPPESAMTFSQKENVRHITEALKSLQMVDVVETKPDCVLFPAPFLTSEETIKRVAESNKNAKLVTLHMEDPPAIGVNKERAKLVHAVITNDISVKEEYETIVGKGRVLIYPNLLIPNGINHSFLPLSSRARHKVYVGYPYPSRVAIAKELITRFGEKGVLFVGDGWDKYTSNSIPTKSYMETLELMRSSWVVLCSERVPGDGGGGKGQFQSLHRGYAECAGGNPIINLVSPEQTHHMFSDEIIQVLDTKEMIEQIELIISNPSLHNYHSMKVRRGIARFSFKTILTRILNDLQEMK